MCSLLLCLFGHVGVLFVVQFVLCCPPFCWMSACSIVLVCACYLQCGCVGVLLCLCLIDIVGLWFGGVVFACYQMCGLACMCLCACLGVLPCMCRLVFWLCDVWCLAFCSLVGVVCAPLGLPEWWAACSRFLFVLAIFCVVVWVCLFCLGVFGSPWFLCCVVAVLLVCLVCCIVGCWVAGLVGCLVAGLLGFLVA